MGCFQSKSSQDSEIQREIMIEQMIVEDHNKSENEFKILLLGPGGSGKSTIFQQTQIIHKKMYKKSSERVVFRNVIRSNTIISIQSLIRAAEYFDLTLDKNLMRHIQQVKKFSVIPKVIPLKYTKMIKNIWKDPGIQNAYNLRNNFHLFGCAKTFLDDIDRIFDPKYVPTKQDILNCRTRTTGIKDEHFTSGSLKFKITDVGGQRNERRKWMHCFQDVTLLIFVASLSGYDEMLFEDREVRRINEALLLFDEISNSRWFLDTSIILFLNKIDLFKEKMKSIDLNVCFKDYNDGCNYVKGLEFIQNKFLKLYKQDNQIFTHSTCAIDTENIKHVFEAIKLIIISNHSKDMGFI
ncbi:guanine nucleotide-binding protein g(o) subunit alpha [Anaeramoeba flamelloides]|uniref:Guanine nucleotide-binding protein g(O) subunit alpha n=1 Tax=Anaeramoeba flamelloides TaxID=1746091 RepID=A0AAV7Y9P9_9EUKA|nr:guanine nucleotide-binding protein g(o) subunit alpha [Anaeramoeba flamelloides]KAJ6228202.1 guanine nucleotide-binding protein g(o) subunit alpha [Anaeramoeba flamelloides]